MRYFVVFVSLLALSMFSCDKTEKKDVSYQAKVECNPKESGFACSIKHLKGDKPLKVCWTIKVTCRNGNISTANACGNVSVSGESLKLVPYEDMSNLTSCDAPAGAELANISQTFAD